MEVIAEKINNSWECKLCDSTYRVINASQIIEHLHKVHGIHNTELSKNIIKELKWGIKR